MSHFLLTVEVTSLVHHLTMHIRIRSSLLGIDSGPSQVEFLLSFDPKLNND